MKKIILFTISLFFLLQDSFAQALASSFEENMVCKDDLKNSPTKDEKGKGSHSAMISSSSLWTVCIAASTVALPLSRNFLAANFSSPALIHPQAFDHLAESPLSTIHVSSFKNIKTNHLFVFAPFEIKIINDGLLLSNKADDFQLAHRSCLNFDFFKHRFSRFTC